jgi:hypothetical protein
MDCGENRRPRRGCSLERCSLHPLVYCPGVWRITILVSSLNGAWKKCISRSYLFSA